MYFLKKIMLEETDENHSLSMSQILEKLREYEVSAERKTLYKDLKTLKEIGVDVIGEKTADDYRYRVGARKFELAEVKILVDTLSASRFVSERKTKQLIKKVSSLVSKYEAKSLWRQVYLCGRVKSANENVYYNVDAIHRAIRAERKIRFIYCNWNTKKQLVPRYDGKIYESSPWGLSFNDESYYMIGFDSNRGELRHYRVDKMKQIEDTDIPSDGHELMERLEVGTYVTQNFGMTGGDVRSVRIRLPERFCGIFVDRFGEGITFNDVGDGMVETTVTIAVSWGFYGWLFGIDDAITVVGPKSVVDEIREFAEIYYRKYHDNGCNEEERR